MVKYCSVSQSLIQPNQHPNQPRSTACGDLGCSLCRFNTTQPCGRSLAARYLAEDPLRAPCGAPIHVKMGAAGGDGSGVETLLGAGTAVEVSF